MTLCLIFFLTLIFIIHFKNDIYLNNQLSSSIPILYNDNELIKSFIIKYSLFQYIFCDSDKYISNTNSIINYMHEILQKQQLKLFIFILSEIPNSENIDIFYQIKCKN